MRSVLRLALLAAILTLAAAAPASAQYMYLDSNGDGVSDSSDRMNANGTPTTVDVYLKTNQNRDGSTAACDTGDGPLSIVSYATVMRAVNGTVTYATPTNHITQFGNVLLNVNPDGINFLYAQGGAQADIQPPGSYRCFTVTITGVSGTPRIDIADFFSGNFTSFGTNCSGNDFDNTYKLSGGQGGSDWTDVDGLDLAQGSVVNTPPTITNPGNRTVAELTPVAFTVTANDPDAGQTLTYTMGASAPAGATINGSTGAFAWTPTEAQGPSTFPITFRATDDAIPPLFDETSISITVTEVNVAPVVNNPGSKTVNELALLVFTVTANDPDLPSNTQTWTLEPAAPTGATLTPSTGAFSWIPSEAQGPGTFPVTFRATDNGTPTLSGTTAITITVNEVNVAPVLAPIGNKTVQVSTLLSFTATATDADLPANAVTFSLDAGAPAGATIGTGTGVFNWTPPSTGAFPVTVRATDNGTPPMSASEAITITVNAAANVAPILGAIGNKTVAELATLAFTATATDANAGQTLTFSLDPGNPAGSTINGTTGAFSWTPTEAQGPGSFPITVRVTDNGSSPLDDSELITITVTEVNVAPVVTSPGNRTVNELVALAFTATAGDADLPANTFTWSLDAGAPAGATIGAGTGAFSWTPTEAQGPGTFPVTIRATDNGSPALAGTAAITITVNEVNVAPVLGGIGNKAATVGVALTFTATATDADIPANTLAFTLDTGAPTGASINGGSGAFTWTPATGQVGNNAITVRVTDNGAPPLSASETITVTVSAAPNQAPTLNAIGNKTVNENSILSFTATATDPDASQTLAFSLDAGAPAGATINATSGIFLWQPIETDGPGSFPITVRVTDNGTPPMSASELITVTVNEVNVAPVLGAIGNKTVNELSALTFTATATDADLPANTLSFSLDAGNPTGSTINASTGAFTWTPTEAQGPGSFPITVRVTDNGAPPMSASELITVTVNEVNVAPVLGAIGNKTVNELATLAFTATATDADVPANTVTFSLDAGNPTGSTINASTGAFSWTPTEAQGPGSFPITVRVTDNGTPPMSASELITVTVNEVNVAPVVNNPGNKTVNELDLLVFTVTANDPDLPTNTLSWSLEAGTPSGTVAAGTGVFSWIPTEAQGPGTFPITFRATDNGTPPLDGTAAITITVNEVNVAPVLVGIGDKAGTVGVPVTFTATATDADIPANTLAFSLDTGAPTGATINASTGAFSWTPTANGSFPVTVRVTDDGTPPLSASEDISIVVSAAPNQAPVLGAIGDKTVNELATLTFTATATDPDAGDNLAFSLDTGAPTGASIVGTTGAFTWQPTEAQGGSDYPITVRVTDDGTPPLSDSETITVTVNEVNVAPELASIGDKTVDELVALTFTATATDADLPANTLSFSLDAGNPTGSTINAATGAFSWTPTEAQGPGSYPVTVRVTDNGTPAMDDFEAITITVNEANVAPVLAAIGNKSGTVGVPVTFTATATDADIPANTLTFSLDAGAPAGATIDGSTGAFSWTPGRTGAFPVTVRVTDNGTPALSAFEAITIDVGAAANQAPVLDAIGNKTVAELSTLAFTATATDPDAGQTLAFTLDAPSPAGATIEASTGAFSWTPTEAQGPVAIPITVRVTDNGSPALSDFETIAVAVTEVNEAPVLAAIGDKAGTVGTPVAFTASATDPDLPANTLTFSLDAGNPAGSTINPTTGAFSWTPGATGGFPVTVRVTDDGTPALNDFEAITITVNAAAENHAPELAAIGDKTVDEGTLLAFTATATDPDGGDVLTFSLDPGAPTGASISSGGAFSWTPTEVQGPGSYPVTVRVTDNGSPAKDDFEAISITVNEVNLAPELTAIGNKSGTVGVAVTFTASATDADIPSNTLTFSLDTGAPADATIDPSTGEFSWTPGGAGSFAVRVRVTDNGIPVGEDFEELTITVNEVEVNDPPVLTEIGDKTVDEQTLLAFTATATDPDAGDVLAFSLDSGAPAGAAITSGGAFSWTPTEAQGPGSYPVTVRVTDNGTPAKDDFEAISITVNEVNLAPELAAIGNKSGTVGVAVAFMASATDADIPTNTLTFSLDSGAPASATIDGSTGAFSWTPAGAGSFAVTVRVTDNGVPAKDDFETITINVVEQSTNRPPVLNAIGDKTVNELNLLAFTASATDPDAGQTLAFTLDAGAPAGATINASTGAFRWTPSEDQGPGTYPIMVRVTDNGTPPLSHARTFQVRVREVNVAPVLAPIGNKTVKEGDLLTFTATATDADIPANTLTFSLGSGAPSGASIGSSSGVFTWTPPLAGSFPVKIRVRDNGSSVMEDFEVITITVVSDVLPANAFFFGINQITILGIKLGTCVQIEPVRGSYSNGDVDLNSIVMKYKDRQISAKCDGAELDGDKNRNGVREIQACFSNSDLQYLFSDLRRGISVVQVKIEGSLVSGTKFRDTVSHYVLVLGNSCLALKVSPNPLNPETVISFATTERGPVTVDVFDVQGRLVKQLQNGTMEAGLNSIRWDGSTRNGNRVATGVYFVNVKSKTGEETIRVTVLK